MQTGRNRTINDRPQLPLHRGLVFLIAVFFSFLFAFEQAGTSANYLVGNSPRENLHRVSDADLFLDSKQLPHFPFESTPAPCEPKPIGKGGETTDNFDDEPDKIFPRASLRQRIDLAATKRELSQQLLSSANDERVPLFVLHHSWKSFVQQLHSFTIES